MNLTAQDINFDISQRSEEWHALRKSKIGASDAAIVMGISPWKTAFQLWEEKTGRRESPPPSFAMLNGIAEEEHICKLYELEHQTFVTQRVICSDEYPWGMASLDGITPDGIIVEFKLANKKVFAEAKKGVVVPHYMSQIQHQLACVPEAKLAHFFIMNGNETCLVEVPRDEEYIAKMMEMEREFYEEYMLKDCPPPLSEKDYIINNEPGALTMAVEWQIAKSRVDDAMAKEKAARARLLEYTDDGNTVVGGVRCQKCYRSKIDYKLACEENSIDASKYRSNQTAYWRIQTI